MPITKRIAGNRIKLSELTAMSGLGREVFLRMKQGGRVSRQEAEHLTGILGTDVQSVLDQDSSLAGDLMAVGRPCRHRPALRLLAQHNAEENPTEDGQRWHMAVSVEPSAARSTTGHTVTDIRTHWDIKVDNYLRQRLSALGEPQGEV